ncbi:MAG: DivIVA domain-containing protein, partial [Candidatus Limnocylindria bacterium]
MSEEPKGLSASGDIIGALSDRVSELTKRVGSLESELDSARKRVAVYEEFDATVRDALSGALRAAHEIRARAENAAQQILEEAREERKLLIKEIERLRGERDGLVDEIASTRRSGFSALRGPRREAAPAPEATVEETAAPDSRALAAEALRGVFTELLEDIRRQAGTVADAAREANAAAEQAKAAQEQARVAQDEARSAQDEARRAVEAQRAAETERAAEAARATEQAQRATEEAARAAEEARRVAEAQRLAQQQADASRALEAERAAEAARAAQEAMRA